METLVRKLNNGDYLRKLELKPVRWCVENLLPQGLTLLVGDPKRGKSWMALDIGIAVSRGDKVLGNYDTDKGDVIYLALEDNDRRLQDRINILVEEEHSLQDFYYCYREDVSLFKDGFEFLDKQISLYENPRLVIIDTLALFLPPAPTKGNVYRSDYSEINKIKQLADKHGVCILAIHHTNKSKSTDAFNDVSGSNAVNGAADSTWVLTSTDDPSVVKITARGRDINIPVMKASFNEDTCRWTLGDNSRHDNKRKYLLALRNRFGSGIFTHSSAMEPLGKELAQSKRIIKELRSSGDVLLLAEREGKAHQYRLIDKNLDIRQLGVFQQQ